MSYVPPRGGLCQDRDLSSRFPLLWRMEKVPDAHQCRAHDQARGSYYRAVPVGGGIHGDTLSVMNFGFGGTHSVIWMTLRPPPPAPPPPSLPEIPPLRPRTTPSGPRLSPGIQAAAIRPAPRRTAE